MDFGSLWTVLGFLLFVAPGLIYESGQRESRPERNRTAFKEAGEVAVASIGLAALSGLFVALLAWLEMRSPNLWSAATDGQYRTEHQVDLAAMGASVVLSAWVFAFTGRWISLRQNRLRGAFTRDPTLWKELAEYTTTDRLVLHVRLNGDREYTGVMSSIDVGTDEDRPFISLAEVSYVNADGDLVDVDPAFQRMLLPLDDVCEIRASVQKREAAATQRAAWLRWEFESVKRRFIGRLDQPVGWRTWLLLVCAVVAIVGCSSAT